VNLSFELWRADRYRSPSQRARVLTEHWIGREAYCPNCGGAALHRHANNNPAADFACMGCGEEFELKSQKAAIGTKLADGSYASMMRRVTAGSAPNLLVMRYDSGGAAVSDLMVVPRQFLVADVIEERRPLPPSARRAGWIGCSILLSAIPAHGRIPIVTRCLVVKKATVMAVWRTTLFLRAESRIHARGWLLALMRCIDEIGQPTFRLSDLYEFVPRLQRLFPGNANIRPKIRQQLQVLRDCGYIEFIGSGEYRVRRG
jgi:type II restriction enzyme